MAKNDKGTWVGKTMQPTFQTYPTAGMIQPATSSSTPTASAPPPPPSSQGGFPTDFTPTLPIGNITIGEGGGYPMIGDITVPNEYLQQQLSFGSLMPQDQVAAPSYGRLTNAVMNRIYGPVVPSLNRSTTSGGVSSLNSIRRNN